jgi:hypothetical protein
VRHGLADLLGQRIYGLALGHEDAHDAARLADDPTHGAQQMAFFNGFYGTENKVLGRKVDVDLIVAKVLSDATGKTEHVYTDFAYAAGTRDRERRVVCKAEVVLLQELRLAARGTAWARAQVNTLRLELLKIGVQVIASVRRLVLRLPAAFMNGSG